MKFLTKGVLDVCGSQLVGNLRGVSSVVGGFSGNELSTIQKQLVIRYFNGYETEQLIDNS